MNGTDLRHAIPALEIGGSHVTAAAVDLRHGRLIPGTRHRAALRTDGAADELITAIADAANRLDLPAGETGELADAWGVAVPGPFDYDTGIARYHDVGKFASLAGVPVGDALTARIRRRPVELRFLNDASAFALGAWHQAEAGLHDGAARSRRLVAITLGTGIGSAFVDDGTVIEDDHRVPPDGRADLLTIDGRPLEDTVSTRAMSRRYHELTGRHVDGLRELSRLSEDGDRPAREVVESAMRRLGSALAPWFAAFGADTVVFGGSMTAAWSLISPPLTAGLSDHDPELVARLRIVVIGDGESTALLGAAVHAARTAGTDPR